MRPASPAGSTVSLPAGTAASGAGAGAGDNAIGGFTLPPTLTSKAGLGVGSGGGRDGTTSAVEGGSTHGGAGSLIGAGLGAAGRPGPAVATGGGGGGGVGGGGSGAIAAHQQQATLMQNFEASTAASRAAAAASGGGGGVIEAAAASGGVGVGGARSGGNMPVSFMCFLFFGYNL